MQFIKDNKKTIIGISIILISLLIAVITYCFNQTEIVSAETNLIETKDENKKAETNKKIKVEIKGAINNPGVYELDDNSRVIDVINIAGGLTENADTSLINLSKKINDEMVIIIYTREEIENYNNSKIKTEYYNNSKIKTEYVYIEVPSCPDKVNEACIEDYKEEKQENKEETNNLININTANIDELTKLSGIGEAKAKLIIEYREQNGKFKEIKELTNVKGIGDSLIEKIKDNITI